MVLSTFFCMYLPLVCFLWEKKNVCLIPLFIFQSDCLVYAIELYQFFIDFILTPCQIYDMQISSPIPLVAFLFLLFCSAEPFETEETALMITGSSLGSFLPCLEK